MGTIGALEVTALIIGGLIGRFTKNTKTACSAEERARALEMIQEQREQLARLEELV